jgi:hypothetical protein
MAIREIIHCGLIAPIHGWSIVEILSGIEPMVGWNAKHL